MFLVKQGPEFESRSWLIVVVAQLAARHLAMVKVAGSTPASDSVRLELERLSIGLKIRGSEVESSGRTNAHWCNWQHGRF